MFIFDDSDIIKHTHRLDQLHRAALPNAIRFTLNNAAFETKKLIPQFADDNFINRKPNFFKRFSGVDQAKGFKIDKMEASVGMMINPQVPATEEIEVQETGGNVKRDKIMTLSSRVSKKSKGVVRKKYRGKANPNNYVKATGKGNFSKGAANAASTDKLLKFKNESGITYIIEISSVMKNIKSRKLKIKSLVIATDVPSRTLNIKKRPFVKPASLEAGKNLNKYFRQNAAKQIKKFT